MKSIFLKVAIEPEMKELIDKARGDVSISQWVRRALEEKIAKEIKNENIRESKDYSN